MMYKHNTVKHTAILSGTFKKILLALTALAVSAGTAWGPYVYYEGEDIEDTPPTMRCDTVYDHPIGGIYFDDTLQGSSGFSNNIYVTNTGGYIIKDVRVIRNCGGSETNVLRGPDLLVGQYSTFKVQQGCDYTVRAWMGSKSKDTTLNPLYEDYFVEFRGSLVTPRTSRIKAQEAGCDSRTKFFGPTVYQHCSYGGYAKTLNEGDYNLQALTALGIKNDDLSSLKVPEDYEITLYEHDNFQGKSVVLREQDDACLTGSSFNDIVSSIRVRQAL